MQFDKATQVEMLAYQMKLADYPRGLNRARIDDLFNGFPPYSDEEVEANNIEVNVNFLESTRLAHDARSQFNNAFLKPGRYFRAKTDMGPVHKRQARSAVVTEGLSKIMKRSLDYFECFRSRFALDVMHGVGPAAWRDQDAWCPEAQGIADVLVPASTKLNLRNLPFFFIYRSFTAPELMELVRKPKDKVDRGWNMPLVERCIEYIDKETMELIGTNWPEIWSPEKAQERVKGDGGFYVGDQAATLDAFDFYFYSEDGRRPGWKRRIILDSWSTPQGVRGPSGKTVYRMDRRASTSAAKDFYANRESQQFLYDSNNTNWAEKREEIVSFQFADLSAVAPFQYHSVRSLGFLLYAVCHLQNRLRCKFTESVFEQLMMLFRVKSLDEAQRALKLDLFNRGFIDDTLQMVPGNERYQPNQPFISMGLSENQRIIGENSSSYLQQTNFSSDRTEKTKFQVMAEVNAGTSLVSAALNQAYQYQTFEDYEILRRFMKADSTDPDVKKFRLYCLKRDVPQSMLVPEAWECEHERIMGAGNKTLEQAISGQLMEWIDRFDPEPQRIILRNATLAITDDAALSEELVPSEPVKVTDSVHDAQLASGALMAGLPVEIKTGMNHIEYVETLLKSMAFIIQGVQQTGGMASPKDLRGLQNMAQHVAAHIQIIAQDEEEKARVKKYSDQLGKLMNLVKQMAQQLQKHMESQQQQNGNGQPDPAAMAKIQATMMTAKAKVQNMRESHAARTAQRSIQFQQQLQQDEQKHMADLRAKDLEAASTIRRNRFEQRDEE